MNSCLVFMPDGAEHVKHAFPKAHYQLGDALWAVGTDLLTSADVCESLGIEDDRRMVVVPVTDYYGRFDRGLWQRLDAWSTT